MLILLISSNVLSSSLADPFFRWRADDKRLFERILSHGFHFYNQMHHHRVISRFPSRLRSTRPRFSLIVFSTPPLHHTDERLAATFNEAKKMFSSFLVNSSASLSDRFLHEIRSSYFLIPDRMSIQRDVKTLLLPFPRYRRDVIIVSLVSNPLLKRRKDLLRVLLTD